MLHNTVAKIRQHCELMDIQKQQTVLITTEHILLTNSA